MIYIPNKQKKFKVSKNSCNPFIIGKQYQRKQNAISDKIKIK